MIDHPQIGVLIPNWNGEAFIERCLASVLAALRQAKIVDAEIVVVDDASEDRSAELIAAGFPSVRLIRNEKNIGFARAVNRGMKAIKADWVFLLNNDLVLKADFCERLIQTLWETKDLKDEKGLNDREYSVGDAERIFAIGALTLDWETQAPNHAGQRAVFKGGMILQEHFDAAEAAPTDFFQAGACLINRQKFIALGGFPAIYHPGYWEDYDLAYEARRRGWVNLYEPRATAWHWGKGSMKRLLGEWGVSLVTRRNHLLFVWANLLDRGLLIKHLLSLPRLVFADRPAEGQVSWIRALAAALERLPAALRLRRKRMRRAGISDRKILRVE